jgi:hypothetical protein
MNDELAGRKNLSEEVLAERSLKFGPRRMFYVTCTFSLPLNLNLKNDLDHIQNTGVFFSREIMV